MYSRVITNLFKRLFQLQMCFPWIRALVVLCGQLILRGQANLSDLSLLSDGYDINEYLVNQQNEDTPWIVSSPPNTESIEQNFMPIFNVDYPTTLDVDTTTSTNHLGNVNHIKNQFGNTFIPSVVDKALNSLLNSDTILTQSHHPIARIANQQYHDNGHHIDHIHDAVSIHKPFGGYKKQTITSGNVQ